MKYYLIIAIIIFDINCTNSDKSVYGINLSDKEKVEVKLKDSSAFNLDIGSSLYSQIQTNESGIIITPRSIINETSLFLVNIPINDNIEFIPVIGEGQGPGEMLGIDGSSVFNDTLVFFSGKSNKIIFLNDTLQVIREKLLKPQSFVLNDFAFAYNKLIADLPPKFNKNKILRIYDMENDSVMRFINYRIPPEYEPRNEFSLLGVVSEEIYYAFVGDKELNFINFKGEQIRKVVFGKNDPLPKPYTVKDFSDIKPVKPYIIKSQLYSNYFLILIDSEFWILQKDNFEFVKRIKLVLEPTDKPRLPIIDFAVTNNTIVFLEGRSTIHQLELSELIERANIQE